MFLIKVEVQVGVLKKQSTQSAGQVVC